MKLIETGFSDPIQFDAETVNDRAKSRASNFQSNADEARSTMKKGSITVRPIIILRKDGESKLRAGTRWPNGFFVLLEAIDESLDRPPIIHIDTHISISRCRR